LANRIRRKKKKKQKKGFPEKGLREGGNASAVGTGVLWLKQHRSISKEERGFGEGITECKSLRKEVLGERRDQLFDSMGNILQEDSASRGSLIIL